MNRVQAYERELADIEREMDEVPAHSIERMILSVRRKNVVAVLGVMRERRSPVSRRMRRFREGRPL